MKNLGNNYTVSTLFLFVLLGSLALGNLSRVTVLPNVQLYIHDIVICMWCGVLLIQRKTTISRVLNSLYSAVTSSKIATFFFRATVAFTLYHLVFHFQLLPVFYLLRLCLYVWFGVSLWTSNLQLPWKSATTLSIVLVALLGLLQYFVLPDTRFLFILGYDDHYNRLIGSFFDPAIIGAVLLLGYITASYAPLLTNKKTQLAIQGLLVFALTLTMSRATYLGLGLAFLLQLTTKKTTFKNVCILIALFLVTSVGVTLSNKTGEGVRLNRTASIVARTATASQIIPTDVQTMLLGTGPFFQPENIVPKASTVTIPNNAKTPDSFLLFLVASFGVPLGLSMGISWLAFLVQKLGTYRYESSILLVLFFISQFNALQLQPFIVVYLCLLLQKEIRVKT